MMQHVLISEQEIPNLAPALYLDVMMRSLFSSMVVSSALKVFSFVGLGLGCVLVIAEAAKFGVVLFYDGWSKAWPVLFNSILQLSVLVFSILVIALVTLLAQKWFANRTARPNSTSGGNPVARENSVRP
jgi:TRAP-type C4-dicarboxylate transport system permease small subunit